MAPSMLEYNIAISSCISRFVLESIKLNWQIEPDVIYIKTLKSAWTSCEAIYRNSLMIG